MFADWNTYVSLSVSSSLGHCSPELWHSISVWFLHRLSAHFPYITFEKYYFIYVRNTRLLSWSGACV